MKCHAATRLVLCCLVATSVAVNNSWLRADGPKDSAKGEAKTRDFLFTYQATITALNPGQMARIWLPVPPSNEDQQAVLVSQKVPGGARTQITKEPTHNNTILYVETEADAKGLITVETVYRIKRREVKAERNGAQEDMAEIEKYLRPDARVPIGGKPMTLLDGKNLPGDQFELARVLYDVVDDHMRYSKEGTGWGNGDAEWACDSKYGNCTDFHSLFISLARTKKIPAKFEMGFPLPDKRGEGEVPGYHCWAKFKPKDKGWIPVDISEANKNPKMRDYYFGNLTENRVAFSEGRDLTLVPKQDGPPLNFFIYPYVEVDGKTYPGDKVKRQFTYKDIAP